MDIKEILIKYWGYSVFRPRQEDIIQSVLEGNDTLALLPTGGGKSLCYQIPGLAREGICLVITPLIALMKDQVENLRKKGIPAMALHSGMKRHEIEVVIDNAIYGAYKFLYISPERLQTEKMQESIRHMQVNLLAVDEAHCISQWGYDFRPPYLEIANIRPLINAPVLALTATATREVITDIQERLLFAKENLIRKSFERKNLTYVVFKEEGKLKRLTKIAGNLKGSGIVYVRNRRKTREIAEYLAKNRFGAGYYHAGMSARDRDRKQDEWIRDKFRIMVATNAFGMGIDKPDVRFVVHMDLPNSLEAYFQEAGRAGRDEKQAYGVMLYDDADVIDARHMLQISYPELPEIRKIYNALGNYLQLAVGSGKDQHFEFDLNDFSTQYKLKPLIVFNALKLLEKEGYIMLTEALRQPSRIHFELKKEDLYRFQVENLKYDSFIKLLLRSYSGLFNEFVKISEQEIAHRADTDTKNVFKLLKTLERYGVLTYIPQTEKPQLIFITNRLDERDIQFSHKNYRDRKKDAEKRLESVINYVSSQSKCRSQQLLEYFGETNVMRCGKCDVCIKRNRMELSELDFDQILEQLKPLLQSGAYTLDELVKKVRFSNEDKILKVFNWLFDNEHIRQDERFRYTWWKK
ncbi:MAG: RecQ family ATP-dependent DNA helicase [Bacteroidales bacterium]|nr:RecQ family ATP-dependent DNA helicase [Bacteroidales bacterium]